MKDVLMQPPTLCSADDTRSAEKLIQSQATHLQHVRPRKQSTAGRDWTAGQKEHQTWGRHQKPSWVTALGSAGIVFLCPILVVIVWASLEHHDGSLFQALEAVMTMGPRDYVSTYFPKPSMTANAGYAAWLVFQGQLYNFLPSKWSTGQLTPAGNLLKYRTNGLLAWVVTHCLAVAAGFMGIVDLAIIAKHWEGLLIAANIYGFLLSAFAYFKAYLAPSYPKDSKFSGSIIYDFYMGIELNPRIGNWDFKLFHNGRPGIVAWTLIDLSFTVYQYQLHGYISNSMLIVDLFHLIYVVDFFINEDWYLRTIDMCHDHFGYYLAWGSMVWLPSMYTLQCQYLARYPVDLSTFSAIALTLTGLSGYALFRSVNFQKDLARRTKGNCEIWGKKAEVMRVGFRTKDGERHESLLLISGWWGVCRHANYLGDLVLSYSMCAVCGPYHLIPWTYAIFMTSLLIHRCYRDEERCSIKYGADWKAYCQKVRWKLIPGVF